MIDTAKAILVVDDEESVRLFLQRMLTEAGYAVATAADGREALDRLMQSKIGVVLMDIKMPKMSGIEALRQIMAKRPETCVVMATAVADIQTAIEAMKLGAYDYITKPFSRDDLIAKLQKAVDKRNTRVENEHRRVALEKKVNEQAERLQQLFREMVETLSREHRLLYELSSEQPEEGKELLSKLPPELQKPMSSVQEFSDALLRILGREMQKQ